MTKLAFLAPFSHVPSIDTPRRMDSAVRLHATDVSVVDGELRLSLHLTYGFAEPLATAFRDVGSALVLHLDSDDGSSIAAPLRDPTAEGLLGDAPYFHGKGRGDPETELGGMVSCQLGITRGAPSSDLYLHVSLQGHVSNRLRVHALSGVVSSTEAPCG